MPYGNPSQRHPATGIAYGRRNGTAVIFAADTRRDKEELLISNATWCCRGGGNGRDIHGKFRVTRMADDMHRAARYRDDHRFGMRRFILRREYRLMKASDNQVQRVQHRAGTVDFALGIFDIGSIPRRMPTPSTSRGQIRILIKCQ